MFGLKSSTYFFTGMSHEPKSSALSMISATQRTTATVNPLIPSSLNGPVVTHGSPNTRGGHTAGFAAALRKLAKQAEEPRATVNSSSHCSEHSPTSSPVAKHCSPANTPKRAAGTIIVPPGTHRVANTPPVVTIAPTQSINGLWRGDGRQPSDSTLRSRSCDHPLSTESLLKKDKPPLATHAAPSHPAFYLSSHPIQESPYSTINLQRPLPHLVTSSSRSDDFLASFRPYHGRDAIRTLSSLPSIGLNSPTAATAAAFYHPAILSHPPYQHPPYRIDDPYFLSLRAPFFHIPQPGTIPSIQASNMQLSLTGMRPPSDVAHSSLSGTHTDHLSLHAARRLLMDDEMREREKEQEHEKREWKRGFTQERELEVLTERARKREKQRDAEWEKETKRRKEMMKQEKHLKIEHGAEQNAILINDAAKRHKEEWKDFISAMEHREPSPGKGKVRTVPLEPITLPGHCSLFNVPSNAPSCSSASEEKYGRHHNHQQQRMDEHSGHGVDFHQHHHRREQGDLFSEQEQDRSRVFLADENQHQPLHIGAPPPLISPQYPLKETSPLLRPFISAHALQPAQALNYSTNCSKLNHDAPKEPEKLLNSNVRLDASKKTTGEHFNAELLKSCTDKDMNESKKSGIPSLRTGMPPHLRNQSSSHQSIKDLQCQIPSRHLEELQKECLDLSFTSGATDLSLKNNKSSPVPKMFILYSNDATTSSVYNEELPLQLPVVSKLDMAENKQKEARMNEELSGCSSSDEAFCNGEIRNRIRRLADRPPLKLDDAPRKMLLLGAMGLTTQSKKDEVIEQRMRRRRQLLRERSPSPLGLEQKPLPPQLPYLKLSPRELNKTSDFEEKKQFLALFNLKHLNPAQKKDIEEALLKICKSKNNSETHSESPESSYSNRVLTPRPDSTGQPGVSDVSLPPPDSDPTACSRRELTVLPRAELCRPLLTAEASGIVSTDYTSSVNGNKSNKLGTVDSGRSSSDEAKPSGMATGRNGKFKLLDKIWHEFQETIWQSTKHQPTDPHKEVVQLSDRNGSSLAQSSSLFDKPKQQAFQMLHQSRQVSPQPDELDSEEEIEQQPKWHGVTDVLEAYHEYLEEKNLEQRILQVQLNRLKERNHELSLTAEHLSVHMLELQSSKERCELERQHQQAALSHLRKCLDLTHCLPTSSYR
ncbi:genetic suppressor element 1-like isoform X1 [Amblyraja radiata]|uniref:genetic suppressor element 1-like isoform X1 n=1 Tax=Amblyraja radiata TaxID=386614 RepID=UPI001402A112|nr:genetic suppressor element 1-like isoform X1 [Amblyraja radiata]